MTKHDGGGVGGSKKAILAWSNNWIAPKVLPQEKEYNWEISH